MDSLEVLALTDLWATGIIAISGTLLGASVGGAITFWIQRSQNERDRHDKHNEQLRITYGTWGGALLNFSVTYHTALVFGNIVTDRLANTLEITSEDKDTVLQMGRDIRDRTLAANDARTAEEVAFGMIMVTDTNVTRVEQARKIRSITLTKIDIDEGSTPSSDLQVIKKLIPKQGKALAEFLIKIAAELTPYGK